MPANSTRCWFRSAAAGCWGAVLAATELNAHPQIIGVQSEFYPSYYAAMNDTAVTPGGATDRLDCIARQVPGKFPRLDDDARRARNRGGAMRSRSRWRSSIWSNASGWWSKAPVRSESPALLAHEERLRGKRVGVIVFGGNIDPGLLASIITRSRMRTGSVACARVHILDRPGQLGAIATAIAGVGGNVLDVKHHRLMGDVPARYAELDLTIELEAGTGAHTVVAALEKVGFQAVIVSLVILSLSKDRPNRAGSARYDDANPNPASTAMDWGSDAVAAVLRSLDLNSPRSFRAPAIVACMTAS